MRDEKGRSNALTLFGIGSVPTDNRVRSLLDPSGPELLHGAFRGLLGLLEGCGALERYRVLGGRREFFLHLHVLTVYHLFRSWEDFEDFVMRALEIGPHAPEAPPELTSKGLIRRCAKRKSR